MPAPVEPSADATAFPGSSAPVPKKGFLRHVLLVGSGSAFSQLIAVMSTPVITRLYSPDDYAVWVLLISVIAIIGVVATFRYELAIVLPAENRVAANLFALAILLAVGVSAATIPLFFVFSHPIERILGFDGYSPWVAWSPLLIVATGIFQSCQSWCIRRQRFGILAASGISLVILTAGGQITAAMLGRKDASGLIVGTLVGQLSAAALILAAVCFWDGREILSSVSRRDMREAAVKFRNYPLFMTPYTLVGILRDRLALFFLNSHAPRVDVAYYAFASRIVNLPVGLVSTAIRPVFFQRASAEGPKSVQPFMLQIMSTLAKLTAPFWVLFVIQAPQLFAWIFSDEWARAGTFAIFLAFPAVAFVLSNWMDRLLDVLGKQRLALKMEVVFSTLSLLSFLVGLLVLESVTVAVAMQSAAVFLYCVAWLWIVFRAAEFQVSQLTSVAGTFLRHALPAAALLLLLSWKLPVPWAIAIYSVGAVAHAALTALPVLRTVRK